MLQPVVQPVFDKPASDLGGVANPRVGLRYVWEFLCDGETPGRVLNDVGVRVLMPYLEGPGTIFELGGAGDYYKNFARPGQPYAVTNLDPPCDRIIDMTAMDLPDNSVDAFLSMYALEHIYDFPSVISESFRCLKPGGRMLLAVPFMYYYHAAPDDFFRFTDSALDKMLAAFNVLKRISFGNRELLVSQLYHEKLVLGFKRSGWLRLMIRVGCLPFLVRGLLGNQHNRVFAITQLYLCEKPSTAIR